MAIAQIESGKIIPRIKRNGASKCQGARSSIKRLPAELQKIRPQKQALTEMIHLYKIHKKRKKPKAVKME